MSESHLKERKKEKKKSRSRALTEVGADTLGYSGQTEISGSGSSRRRVALLGPLTSNLKLGGRVAETGGQAVLVSLALSRLCRSISATHAMNPRAMSRLMMVFRIDADAVRTMWVEEFLLRPPTWTFVFWRVPICVVGEKSCKGVVS